MAAALNEAALADALDAARRGATLLDGTATPPDLAAAYRVAAELERRRAAAGDAPRGWKIGFTNRSIWPRYGVHEPIWGRVWRTRPRAGGWRPATSSPPAR